MKKSHVTPSRYKAFVFFWFVLGVVFAAGLQLRHNPVQAEADCVPVIAQTLSVSPVQATPLAANTTAVENDAPIHILLIGQDRRDGEICSRSDCMILCTFFPDRSSLTLTSFLRDLYVRIPGYGRNRLNAAYAFGGLPLLRQTFQENFQINVDGCVEVDFGQFHQLVDLLGGVSIALRADEAEHINAQVPGSTLVAGQQHLNAEQALAYSRIRSLDADGDFSRTNRQRNVLIGLLERCKNATVAQMLLLFRKASAMISTDIPKTQLLSLVRELAPRISQLKVHSQRIPLEGTYSHQIIDGMAVLAADLESARKFLRQSLSG